VSDFIMMSEAQNAQDQMSRPILCLPVLPRLRRVAAASNYRKEIE
jgi:hypothetical protein